VLAQATQVYRGILHQLTANLYLLLTVGIWQLSHYQMRPKANNRRQELVEHMPGGRISAI